MGKISTIFNFDNIGGKIKAVAKWSCWITILLIWIAAPIALVVMLADDMDALCLIPIAGAIVGPVFVWLGSWGMYAFGEFVEDIHALRGGEPAPVAQPKAEKVKRPSKRVQELQDLLARGVITEDEYSVAMAKE